MTSMNDMKKAFAFAVSLSVLFSCAGRQDVSSGLPQEDYSFRGCALGMTGLKGGMVTIGAFRDGRPSDEDGKVRMVAVDGFSIALEPVSQELWEAVMGKNPSSVKSPSLPVNMVSWKDAEKFVSRLSRKTGIRFVVPDEAMWELALRRSAISPDKKLREWCRGDGPVKTVRTAVSRDRVPGSAKAGDIVFRLAVMSGTDCPVEDAAVAGGESLGREKSCENEKIECNGAIFNMIAVRGGTKALGVTEYQARYAEEDEFPEYSATVGDFEIAETEVTVGQWLAVMGYLPYGNHSEDADYPVINVSWYAAQEFVLRLREKTGRKFRLPSEAEWEYAARGGADAPEYRYSGSNQISLVAVHGDTNPSLKVRPVASLFHNGLGLYDMSGNAWEWCEDSYSSADSAAADSELKVMKGGSAASRWSACRVSNRSKARAGSVKGTFGFRLAI